METAPPKKRWFQFSLSELVLIGVLVAALLTLIVKEATIAKMREEADVLRSENRDLKSRLHLDVRLQRSAE